MKVLKTTSARVNEISTSGIPTKECGQCED